MTTIRPAGRWNAATARDRIALEADDRQRRRIVLKTENGAELLLDFATPVTLRDGDGLVLDDGAIVEVAGVCEPLVELAARTALDLVRLAWHLGNRHTDVEISADRIRIRCDHVLEDMVRGLGARLSRIDAPFNPESGVGP